VVEGVEELEPQLKLVSLPERNVLHHSRICVKSWRTLNDVAAAGSVSTIVTSRKGSGVKVLFRPIRSATLANI
jgi:hypothetical protein